MFYKYGTILLVLVLIVGGTFALLRDKKPVESVSVAQEAVVEEVEKECTVTDSDVISAVNKYRAEVGAKPVVFSQKLDDFSNQRAIEQNGTMDNHVGLVGAANALLFYQVGEIQNRPIGGCLNSLDRVNMFKSSPSHWSSLTNPKWIYVGVGFYNKVLVINFAQ